ncbi:MAG: hypothetical protein NZM25_05645 [Leptospiraceae bacterium]|nr:hypothetical protein [Leptospiraceae bacterium]MDW8306530.1 hypothetical protein [Leptospiraceae bacterium]
MQGKSSVAVFSLCLALAFCSSRQERYFLRAPLTKGASVAIIVEGENDVKNAVFTEFLKAGFQVKAFSATDFYRVEDVFEIRDIKKIAFTAPSGKEHSELTARVLDKNFENLYKLHLYNFEASKAEIIKEIRAKYKVDYLILLAMKEWDTSYSWIRVINLDTFDLIYIHNYPARRSDTVQSIIARFLEIMQKPQ